MTIPGWSLERPGATPLWLAEAEPLTTGLLAQSNLRLWCAGTRAALGIRSGGVVYPVVPSGWDPELIPGARTLLGRVADQWCLMGPSPWVEATEPLMPGSQTHRVGYQFLVRPRGATEVLPGAGELRLGAGGDSEALFVLQEAYEKEEVLFRPEEFQPLVSRLHFWKSLKDQEIVGLWEGERPLAKAGTNALTPRWAQLGGVYTRPEERGRGHQKRLLSFLLARLEAQGRGACLFVKKGNVPALALYAGLGFQPRGDFTILYGERSAPGPR